MRSYPLLIDGRDEPAKAWSYIVPVSEQIRDVDAALTLKRQLDLGRIRVEDQDPERVPARCAWGEPLYSELAVEAASRASREFARVPVEERLEIAADVHQALLDRKEELIEVLAIEGHPRKLALWELSGMLSYTCPETLGWLARHMNDEIEHAGRKLRIVRRPDGVVCLNPPQNAAMSNSIVGVLALAVGNALVVKAPRSVPLGVMHLYREIVQPILERRGAPRGLLNVVCGPSPGILRSWVQSPIVDDIVFFGESKTGLRLGEDAYRQGKKTWLELSGNDGFLVWRDADLDRAAETLLESFYGSSQICMVPKYAVIHPDVEADFLERFLPKVRALQPGDAHSSETLLTPVLKPAQFFEMLNDAEAAGAKRLFGGERVDVDGRPSYKGLFLEPTPLRVDGLDLAQRLECVHEETFFPLLPIVIPEREPDAALLDRVIEFMNATPYGLRTSLWARDRQVIERFIAGMSRVGIIKVNDSHIGFPPYIAVHGGPKQTGGPYGELSYPAFRLTHLQGVSMIE